MLTRGECAMLRAIAIVAVIVHNLASKLPGMVEDNEFSHDPGRVVQLLQHLLHPAVDAPLQLISFLAFYALSLFLFLSGYGLVLKYERAPGAMPSASRFVAHHYLKLLIMMAPGLLCFLAWFHFVEHHALSRVDVAAQLAMVVNLLSEPWYRINPGPYWYLGMVMQVYVLYRLVLYPGRGTCWRWLGPVLLAAGSVAAMVLGAAAGGHTLGWLRYNLPMAGLPLACGLLVARYGIELPRRAAVLWATALLAPVLLLVMNGWFFAWLFSPLVAIAGGVALVRALPQCCRRPLEWVGALSAAIYIVHPVVRPWFVPLACAGHHYLWLAVFMVVSTLLAVPYRWLVARLMAIVEWPTAAAGGGRR